MLLASDVGGDECNLSLRIHAKLSARLFAGSLIVFQNCNHRREGEGFLNDISKRHKTGVSALRARKPSTLLKQLFLQFQQQIDDFEKRVSTRASRERDAKSLGALAVTLDRLNALDNEMKKKNAPKRQGSSSLDRDKLLRTLCDRLEKFVRRESAERKDQRPADSADD